MKMGPEDQAVLEVIVMLEQIRGLCTDSIHAARFVRLGWHMQYVVRTMIVEQLQTTAELSYPDHGPQNSRQNYLMP